MQPLNEILWDLTVPDLKALAALLPTPGRVGNKDVIIADIQAALLGPSLRALWDRLDTLQKLAVADCLYSLDGEFKARQFEARYGALPQFDEPPPAGAKRYSYSTGAKTRLRLFLFASRLHRQTVTGLPAELHAPLRAFVPEPAPSALATTPALPERAHEQPLQQRQTQRDALLDLGAMLRLAEQGKLQVSETTSLASATTLRLVAEKLHGGDFYANAPVSAAELADPGPIKAFAWPLLLHAAGLAQRNGAKSALSPAGRKALATPAAEVLRTVWQKWLKSHVLDEFSRVDFVKGQRSKGAVMTALLPRRAAVVEALASCPVGEWIAVDELSRQMQAEGLEFEVAHDPWKLYLGELQYGSLGYQGSNGWGVLQLRYLLAFLFEIVATLGLVDVAFVAPEFGHNHFRDLWGADCLPYLSRYDGLLYLRLTPLGAYCLGVSDQFSAPEAPSAGPKAALSALPSLSIQVHGGRLEPEEVAQLETWAVPVSDSAWLLDRQKALVAVEGGISTQELDQFLRSRDSQPLPPTVEAFIQQTQAQGTALTLLGPALLIECSDAQIAQRIAGHAETAKLCLLAGERQLVVRSEQLEKFRARVRVLGFGMRS